MYSYTYDSKTGGLLLNLSPTKCSKEPRPVYAQELDILGFNEYWKYDEQIDYPYMWAEANRYYYRGTLVAALKGGNIYNAPEIIIPKGDDGKPIKPEKRGGALRPVDIPKMIKANREILEIIEQTTVKKILAIYAKYKDRLDCFHVAFSGGKDSCVLLDLVKKALPKGSFVVVFGDTGMEFPDTYEVIEKTKKNCIEEAIPFYIAKSHLNPKESWELFGPPSRVLRWCCSVHKTTPQTLKLREITGKDNYMGLAFVGVRAQESATRAEYNYESYSRKQKGQYSHNSILEWTSAEIWLYIYANNVILNEAYKKGNQRVGCLFCPMSAKTDFLKSKIYTEQISNYKALIEAHYSSENIANKYWCTRSNGALLKNNEEKCKEYIDNREYVIEIINPNTDWKQWIITLGEIPFSYIVETINNGFVVRFDSKWLKEQPIICTLLKRIFHKAAYCIGCRVCETNCRRKCISFNEKLKIVSCIHCQECNQLDGGCLVYNSRKYPTSTGDKKMKKSVDCFNTHAPKTEWLQNFFSQKDEFLKDNNLGPDQKVRFKRFLRESGLLENDKFSSFAELLFSMGWDTKESLALMLSNLAYNAQFNWYIRNLDIGRVYTRKEVVDWLIAEGNSEKNSNNVAYAAYKRLVETPLGTSLHWGFVTDEGDLVRTKCSVSDPRVVLYGLFKFAEKCNDYKEFTLATLLNDSIDRDGISPTRIFGLDREDMTPILLGLSAKYPEFITASFTHDLEKITLSRDKSSQDVLGLFKEDTAHGSQKQIPRIL